MTDSEDETARQMVEAARVAEAFGIGGRTTPGPASKRARGPSATSTPAPRSASPTMAGTRSPGASPPPAGPPSTRGFMPGDQRHLTAADEETLKLTEATEYKGPELPRTVFPRAGELDRLTDRQVLELLLTHGRTSESLGRKLYKFSYNGQARMFGRSSKLYESYVIAQGETLRREEKLKAISKQHESIRDDLTRLAISQDQHIAHVSPLLFTLLISLAIRYFCRKPWGDQEKGDDEVALDPYEVAYLMGGRLRTLQSVTAALLHHDHIAPVAESRSAELQAAAPLPSDSHPLEKSVYQALGKSGFGLKPAALHSARK